MHVIADHSESPDRAQAVTARQISFRLGMKDASTVNVHLTEKAGKVDVAVRASDQSLGRSLQTNLGELVDRLEGAGFRTETWLPAPHSPSPNAPQRPDVGNGRNYSGGHSDAWSGQHSGKHESGSQQRRRSTWPRSLQATFSSEQTRIEIQ
jgi:hypothetical protein